MRRNMSRRAAPRRKLIWARQQQIVQDIGAGAAVDLLASYRALGGDTLGCSIARVRIDIQYEFGAVSDEGDFTTFGVIVDQLQADLTEVPRPGEGSEPHADWMYWRTHMATGSGVLLTDGTPGGQVQTSFEVDIRAQRKMEELQETLYLVVQPSASQVLAGVDFAYGSSVLLRLP